MRKKSDEQKKTFVNQAAQGDVLFIRIDEIPKNVKKVTKPGPIIVAHSETGHHHTIESPCATLFEDPKDPFTCYLRVAGEPVEIVHHRPWDTHDSIVIQPGNYIARRPREQALGIVRMVRD